MNILIAEDDKDLAEIYLEMLLPRGYSIKLAYDGEECVNRYKANRRDPKKLAYDVVILDYSMPNKNGAEATKEILQENLNQRIIFVSAFGKDLLHDLEDTEGEIDFLTKPFTSNSLIDLVEGKRISLKEKLKNFLKVS